MMVRYIVRILGLVNEEGGQALAEYSLILAFIAVACIVALGALGLAVAGQLGSITSALP